MAASEEAVVLEGKLLVMKWNSLALDSFYNIIFVLFWPLPGVPKKVQLYNVISLKMLNSTSLKFSTVI